VFEIDYVVDFDGGKQVVFTQQAVLEPKPGAFRD
jgi:hypothetical protein